MFGPFGDYVIPWYGRELDRLESLIVRNEGERKELIMRVQDMRVEIDDLADEGFVELSSQFDLHYNAGVRLQQLYDTFYLPGDSGILNPLPRADRLIDFSEVTDNGYGEAQPLTDYLKHLENITYNNVSDQVRYSENYSAWRTAAGIIIDYQLLFAEQILSKKFDTLVALLRDMLPQYLIARWKDINVLPLPLGRSYLDRFGPNYEAYDNLTCPLYQALKKEPNDFNKMWKEAVKLTRERNTGQECMRKMEQALRNEYSFLQKAGSLLVVETGLQATMPLFLESVFDNMEWFMFTAAPWLLDIYRDRIFCHQYSMLRPCETLFCTDNLFTVSFENGKCFARETLNPLIRNLAYWEIAALKQRSS